MQKEITQLLHLLNKGVESLPGTLQNLVTEYARQQTVMAIIMGILVTTAIVIVAIGARLVVKYAGDAANDEKAITGIFMFVGAGILALVLMIPLFGYTSHALAPTLSLIRSLR